MCVCCRHAWVAASGAAVAVCVCVVDARGSQQAVLVCAHGQVSHLLQEEDRQGE